MNFGQLSSTVHTRTVDHELWTAAVHSLWALDVHVIGGVCVTCSLRQSVCAVASHAWQHLGRR